MAADDYTWISHIKVVKITETGKVCKIDEVNGTMTWYADETDYGTSTPISDGVIGTADDKKVRDIATNIAGS